MRRVISFMHISLDGFVASTKGDLSWVSVDEEIFTHVGKRIGTGDTALYGRKTFEMMESYWPTAGDKPGASKHDIEHAKWYASVRKLVLSKTLKREGRPDTEIINDNLITRINELKQQGGEDILVFGSPSATHALMQHKLIDGYWLFVNPIILGEGVNLFSTSKARTKLNLESSRQFANGVTELSYGVVR